MNISKIFLSVLALVLFAGAATAQDPVPLYPDNYKVVLENERVRVLDFKLKKGAKEDFHAHQAAVTYVLSPRFASRFPTAVRESAKPHRKNKSWMTEITTWKHVSDGPPM